MKFPTKKKKKLVRNWFIDRFDELEGAEPSKETLVVNNLRGSKKSSILLIAPPMNEEEYGHGIPFSGLHAQLFHKLLKKTTGLDTNEDFLVVSCSKWGAKANKASTTLIAELIESSASRNLFSMYVVVGSDSFRYIFGKGKKTSMNTLAGRVIYLPNITGQTPVFVLPDIENLLPDVKPGEEWKIERLQEEAIEWHTKVASNLKTAIDNLNGN